MGLLGSLKSRLLHRDEGDMDFDNDVGMTRSRVLGEPVNDIGNDDTFMQESRYAPPGLNRMNPTRTHNIGPPESEPPIAGRRADDLMPADQFRNQSPMFSPAPASPFNEPPTEAPPSMPSVNDVNNRIIDKLDYLREDIKNIKHDIELMNERIKNIQNRIEERRY